MKKQTQHLDFDAMLKVALQEAKEGYRVDKGIPVGAALFDHHGNKLSQGRNRRVQDDDPTIHGETDAFRKAGRIRNYSDKIMVTTLAPCWYCSGLIRQFQIGMVVVGESVNFAGGIAWLRRNRIKVVDLNDPECISLMAEFIKKCPELWYEDIGIPPKHK